MYEILWQKSKCSFYEVSVDNLNIKMNVGHRMYTSLKIYHQEIIFAYN